MGSLGVDVPSPYGPQPAPPGPVPADWQDQPAGSPAPSPTDPGVPAQTPLSTPDPSPPRPAGDNEPLSVLALVAAGVLLAAVGGVLVMRRRPEADQERPPTAR